MLVTIAVLMLVLWLLGMISAYTLGGFIHILLVIAIISILIRIIQGRTPVWRVPPRSSTAFREADMNGMTPLAEVAILVATAALVVIAFAVVRAMGQLAKAVDLIADANGPVAKLLADAARTTTEVRQLVVKLETMSESLSGVGESFRDLGDRAVTMSAAILDEVEPPVERAVALMRGLRAGAEVLAERWGHRQEQQERGVNSGRTRSW
jgi:methyl-accepting chemotaxis protein